ncbi:carboxypeptidase-like regulatory domain-containing protein [Prevotella sp. A2931]|uniref:Carboxypeptidase-like regulatory domain-containing protein n=1 Tax=Prevotella illustrans TaxID=2800387 RepID=A0ABS3M1Z7_9BACT|nr:MULTISPECIES: carboxypeptidase-like regulatory domain-containing protein [Prevotella]MBO1362183.1 carboxypeptidase-like regulatory domain-containing protein [Prevotella illustrans]PTL26542.1 hypothetical protein C3V39_05455 [Prevotella sp. oral taxon 820]
MKQILTIYVCLLLFPLQIKAYNIQGKIIDQIENQTLTGANVIVRKDSITILKTTQTNENGRFFIKDISEPNISIEISYFGYKGIVNNFYGNSSDINMGYYQPAT